VYVLCADTLIVGSSYSQRQERLTVDGIQMYFVFWRLHFCPGEFMWFLYSLNLRFQVVRIVAAERLFAESAAIAGTGKISFLTFNGYFASCQNFGAHKTKHQKFHK
jgi:hypothetical protein